MTIVSKIRMGALLCEAPRFLVGTRPPGEVDVPVDPDAPPASDLLTDPYWDQVVLLVGADNGITEDESSRHKGGGVGAVSTNTAFGPYSIDCTNTPSRMDYGGGDDFSLAPDQMHEFTIDGWIYLDATVSDVETIVGRSFLGVTWIFCLNGTELRWSYQVLETGFGGGGAFTNIVSTGANIVGGKWWFVAVDKDASRNIRLYLGDRTSGVVNRIHKATPNDASIDGSQWINSGEIGLIGLFGTNKFYGKIDELRITNGTARYKTDLPFPIPPAKWPRPPFPVPGA